MYDSVLFYSIPRSGTKVARRYVSLKTGLENKGEITSIQQLDELSKSKFVCTIHSYTEIPIESIIEKANTFNSKIIVLVRPNFFDFVVSGAVNNIIRPSFFLPGNQVISPSLEEIYKEVFSMSTHFNSFKKDTDLLINEGAVLRFPPIVGRKFDNIFVKEYSTNATVVQFKNAYKNQFLADNAKNYFNWNKFCESGTYLSEDDLTNITIMYNKTI